MKLGEIKCNLENITTISCGGFKSKLCGLSRRGLTPAALSVTDLNARAFRATAVSDISQFHSTALRQFS